MSTKPVPEDLRLRLAQSIPVLERHRPAIAAKLRERVQTLESGAECSRQAEIKTAMLMDLLIAGASDIAAFGGLRGLSRISREHQRLGIDGRHYSRFGLALGRALRQVPGITLSPQTISAWGDVFWIIVSELVADPPAKPLKRGIFRLA